MRFLAAMQGAEGGSAAANPLNTTFKLPGSTDYNDNVPPVQNYPRATWGVLATALTLTNGNYGGILGDLQAGTKTAERIVRDRRAQIKTWGTDADLMLDLLKEIP